MPGELFLRAAVLPRGVDPGRMRGGVGRVPASHLASEFQQALVDCRQLYLQSAREVATHFPHLLTQPPREFIRSMDDLHRGLLVKIYFDITLADGRKSAGETHLGEMLIEHVWDRRLRDDALREALQGLEQRVGRLSLASLIRPFLQIAPLRQYTSDLITVLTRLVNVLAKADGDPQLAELRKMGRIMDEMTVLLSDQTNRATTGSASGNHERDRLSSRRAASAMEQEARSIEQNWQLPAQDAPSPTPLSEQERADQLARAMSQLDGLIGLEAIKDEIHTLANFLKIQKERQRRGLSASLLSLHMVFTGNPGTGKTTVARIVGQIFQAMGVLKKGHLVETDRGGLVAQYAGQTAPKTSALIDESLDGILFIDEAYSLVAEESEDAFGQEALQTLLKRMEDDRERLVVILAGYPEPMERLLRSNPGLCSRFSRTLQFPDYTPQQLGQIFERLCGQHQYKLLPEVRHRLLVGFEWLYKHRDEHFGNGRLVRNTFEDAVRRLANRIAPISRLTHNLLTQLKEDDVALPDVPAHIWTENAQRRYCTRCPGCGGRCQLGPELLGRRMRCPRCQSELPVDWPEPSGQPPG